MKKLLTLAAIAIALVACQKEISNITNIGNGADAPGALQQFFADNKATPESFTADNAQPIGVIGKNGSVIRFPDNAFVTKSGAAVTGNVKIELLEIYTAADMILNNKLTMSNGLPLSSGGEFSVRVTQNGEELKLAPGKFMNIQLKPVLSDAAMQGMQVFNGQTDTIGNINWTANANAGNAVTPLRDSAGAIGYNLFADSVQWINCDRLINEPLISYSFDASAAPADSNLAIYVHLTGRNSVLGIYERTADLFKSEKLIAAPVTIVAISVKEDKIYAAFMPITLADKGTAKLVFEPITEEALKQRLQLLK